MGKLTHDPCPDNLVYSMRWHECVPGSSSNCPDSISYDIELAIAEGFINPKSLVFQSRRALMETPKVPGKCETRPGLFYVVADLTDCSRFYVCNSGTETRETCPNNTLFSVEDMLTSVVFIARSLYERSAVGQLQTGNSFSNGAPQWGSSQAWCSLLYCVSASQIKCENICSSKKFEIIPNEYDDTKFYVCNEGKARLEQCPRHFTYDPVTVRCTS
ncbi:unnamed protein product [Chrysodeixis includens]|uniref:Chitin-binding type-2 domain-containing protein n=1 Tax=Chrysodeixis includens TaxID=689277 RepID=A0A9N8Q355_CHRIL|nr:unnamed protein product [Chrysodeixis includens]